MNTSNLYEHDIHAWTRQTAELLRQGRFQEVDIEHLVEELESMARRDRQELQQGEARTLLRQLTRKFGPEAAQRHRERIETAEVEQLDAWLDRILTADTPETIFH